MSAVSSANRALVLKLYVAALVLVATAMTGVLAYLGFRLGSPVVLVFLCLIALVAERESIQFDDAMELSVASVIFVFAALIAGPLAAVVVGAVGILADLPRRDGQQPILRWLAWTSSRMIVAGLAGVTAAAVGAPDLDSFGMILAAVAAATGVEVMADLVLTSTTTSIRGTSSLRAVGRSVAPLILASVPLYAPVISVLTFAYNEISPWSTALFFAPAFAAHRLFLLYRRERSAAEALAIANVRIERASMSFASALVATLDARDRYTAGHSAAVAIYARDIAQRMGLSEEDQQRVHLCGLVHDLGKIGLPPGLLEKPGALTLEERRQMEQHPVIGERILRNVDDYADIAVIVRHHHERVDGHGYPDGIQGDSVPLLSRIIAVADAYNAMTSDRPYRDAMPSRVARLRLAQAVESQFDTAVVAAFEAILAGASESYRLGQRKEFGLTEATARCSGLSEVA